jgi:hypothetical protein
MKTSKINNTLRTRLVGSWTGVATLATLLAGLSTTAVQATEELLTETDQPTLHSREATRIPKVLAGRTRSVQVKMSALQAETLSLTLFDDTRLTAVRDRLEKVRGHFTWVGHIEGYPDSEVILAVRGRALMGTINWEGQLYEIVYKGQQLHQVRQLDPKKMAPNDDEPIIPNLDEEPLSPPSKQTRGAAVVSTGQVVDLMVVYTSKAKANAGGVAGIEAKIINAVAKANQAYLNSQVNMYMNLVKMAEVNYTETGNMSSSLSALRSKTDGKMDEVHTWRDQVGADQVVLISADTNYCGLSYQMTSLSTGFASFAFSVVHDDSKFSCLGQNTLAHELGHVQGNAHDPANANPPGIYPYSQGYRICGLFRDIMSYSCQGETRIPYFSNPSVAYQGQPTGLAEQSDTARSMNNTVATVANFRASVPTSVPTAPNTLTATALSSYGVALNWVDAANNETGFKIQRSLDGVNFSEIASLGNNVTQWNDSGLSAGVTYTYRVYAYNSIGNSANSNIVTVTTPAAPTAPSSLTAIVSSVNQVNLSWIDTANNETGFKIQRSLDGVNFSEIASLGNNVTQWNDSGLSAGVTYTYRVYAYNSIGNSANSNIVTVTTPAAPTAPSNLTAIASSADLSTAVFSANQVNLSWVDTANNEIGFKVLRSLDGVNFSEITALGSNITQFTDSGLSAGTTYFYRVVAYNEVGLSGESNTVTVTTETVPMAPTGLTANALSANEVALSWTDAATNEIGFKVQRSLDGVNFSEVATLDGNATSYTDTGLSAGSAYSYRVVAYNNLGPSTDSNTVMVTTPAAPTAPTNLTAVASSSTSIVLNWVDTANNETGFKVLRSQDGVSFTELASLASDVTSYTDTSLNNGMTPGATYSYRVVAYNSIGNSIDSNTAAVTVTSPLMDTQAPIVTISNPINASMVVTSAITVTATATDDVQLATFMLYLDGNLIWYTKTSNINYRLGTRSFTPGNHTIKAVATDTSGNIAETSVTVIK